MNILKSIIVDFWNALAVMAPYLLFGFLVAGILYVLLPTRFVRRQLGSTGFMSIFKASLFGVPLPLCSCGVIPVTTSLRKSGASRSAAISFLLSTPQTGVDSILVTYSMLGFIYAAYRPIVAFITGLAGGLAVRFLDPEKSLPEPEPEKKEELYPSFPEKPVHTRILRHALVTLPEDVGGAMLVGLVIAALISVFVPEDFFVNTLGAMGTGLPVMFLMLIFGIPVYVCSAASVPVAAALIAKGLSPGAAMVFLMTGPATNAVAIVTIARVMGLRTAIIYISTVVAGAISSGLVLDAVFPGLSATISEHMHGMSVAPWEHITAVILMAVLIYGVAKKMREKK